MNRPTIIALIGLAVAAVALILAVFHEREEADTAVPQPLPPVAAAVAADARGEWVFVPAEALPPGSRELRLKALNPDGATVESTEPVVLVVPERGKGPALAVKALRGGGSKVLQSPAGNGGGLLSLDVVDHDDKGRLFVGGKAPAAGKVFLYLDNKLIGQTDADSEGGWRIGAAGPKSGDKHALRADLIGDKGKVLARVEVVWTPGEDLGKGTTGVVVESGNSLWRIARRLYGRGVDFTVIYEANRERIKDPDLIYPGQVFSVPNH